MGSLRFRAICKLERSPHENRSKRETNPGRSDGDLARSARQGTQTWCASQRCGGRRRRAPDRFWAVGRGGVVFGCDFTGQSSQCCAYALSVGEKKSKRKRKR